MSDPVAPEIVVTLNRGLIEFKFDDAESAEAFVLQLNNVVQTWEPCAQGVHGPFARIGADVIGEAQ